jgi:anti-sigma factor RsiW
MSEQHVTPEMLIDYMRGELPEHEDAATHAHISGCSQCAEAHESETALTDLLREHARSEERELPAGMLSRIQLAIAAERKPTWWDVLMGYLRPAIAIPVAAGLILGAVFGLASRHSAAQATTIDAAYYLDDHAALAPTTPFQDGCAVPATLSSGESESEETRGNASH